MARKRFFNFPFFKREVSPSKEEVFQNLDRNRKAIDRIVSKHFFTYESGMMNGSLRYCISAEPKEMEEAFENVRVGLKKIGMLVTVVRERNELSLHVFPAPTSRKRSIKVNIILFVLTLASTTWAGTNLWAGYTGYDSGMYGTLGAFLELFEVLLHPHLVLYGAFSFALPILLILGLHETGHYLASRKNKVDASLPFFLPVPPPFILGTFGAFISIREPMPSKKALMQIGAAGPIVGFIVAIPVTLAGLFLSTAYPGAPLAEESLQTMVLGEPLIFRLLSAFFTLSEDRIIHPTAFAGWVGLLVTAFNLLPAGQLDGGHIARALFGRYARYFSYLSVAILVLLSFNYHGWILFAFLILLLGVRHPPPLNDISPLRFREKMIGVFSIMILVFCFIPVPIEFIDMEPKVPGIQLEVFDDSLSVNRGGEAQLGIMVNNTGPQDGYFHIVVSVEYDRLEEVNVTSLLLWNVSMDYLVSPGHREQQKLDLGRFMAGKEVGDIYLRVPAGNTSALNVTMRPAASLPYGAELRLNITAREKNYPDIRDFETIGARISTIDMFTPVRSKSVLAEDGIPNAASFFVRLENVGARNDTVNLSVFNPADWDAWLSSNYSYRLAPGENETFLLRVQPPMLPITEMSADIVLKATSSVDPGVLDELRFSVKIVK